MQCCLTRVDGRVASIYNYNRTSPYQVEHLTLSSGTPRQGCHRNHASASPSVSVGKFGESGVSLGKSIHAFASKLTANIKTLQKLQTLTCIALYCQVTMIVIIISCY